MKIYISGALTAVENIRHLRSFYEAIGRLCETHGYSVHIPHLYTDPVLNVDISPSMVFNTDKAAVLSSDILIAYLGVKSFGVGMELAYAEEYKKPLILLYEKSHSISRMVRGIPNILLEIIFNDQEACLYELDKQLFNIKQLLQEDKIFIIENIQPNGNYSVSITNDNGDIITKSNNLVSGNDMEALLRQAKTLGMNPSIIYIDHFSKRESMLLQLWPSSTIKYTYR